MSDDELKLTRRLFLQHSAMVSAMSAGWCSIALKTDALAQQQPDTPQRLLTSDGVSPYPYLEPPP
jgi:hypothetical protein